MYRCIIHLLTNAGSVVSYKDRVNKKIVRGYADSIMWYSR